MLLLPSGLCTCLHLLCTLLWPSGLCGCLLWQVCVYLHAALAIGALQMLVVKCLCLFASCSCHHGFADAWILLCTLLLPSELCRCLWLKVCVYLHAALAIRALQVLAINRVCLFARCSCLRSLQVLVIKSLCIIGRCSCHRGFAGVWICYARSSCQRGFAGDCDWKCVFICMLLLPSGLCRCLWLKVCVYMHAALAIGALQMLVV